MLNSCPVDCQNCARDRAEEDESKEVDSWNDRTEDQ